TNTSFMSIIWDSLCAAFATDLMGKHKHHVYYEMKSPRKRTDEVITKFESISEFGNDRELIFQLYNATLHLREELREAKGRISDLEMTRHSMTMFKQTQTTDESF